MTRALTLLALLLLLAWVGPSPVAAGSAEDSSGMSCVDCHEEVVLGMAKQVHMRIEPFEVNGRTVGCEGCHGDGTRHMEAGGDASLIKVFDGTASGDDTCLECHGTHGLPEWNASTHAQEELSCSSCHSIHTQRKPLASCLECHSDVVAQFQLPYHHPVKEEMMTCNSCHNPHAATESMLVTHERSSELCFSCHQDKQGPFIFEHDPVQEDCTICHNPHGTVSRGLLTMGEPALCLQCHEFHFHAGYEAVDELDLDGEHFTSSNGAYSFNAGFATRCTSCHMKVHGSDLPTQGTPSSGRGLGR